MGALHSEHSLDAQLATAQLMIAQYSVQIIEYDRMDGGQRRYTERGKDLASRIGGLRSGLRKWMERAAELEAQIETEKEQP